ncbi:MULTISPECIES: methyl-accepting chemotaxis protein [unclassified Modicisalibacter]|uniref:methyl-accepting chemotaxis protein n=1 Tax=unclassified Modicisalibacter TaxID=2679913 RepID=UPI001CCF2D10|nr:MULTISPECIES: methyl-accepting chemotaxis protein [unclassified Modicisalibacter]MBZ9556500.1 Tar ligand binding domain-containing protein [Modicisalibacter sp. R2A 31.J]MBZ9575031.1 Tar ligand binding domain-containing protein [Modicisalibacter sp. MOD 31.J]
MHDISIRRSLTFALAALVIMIGLISALGIYANNASSTAVDELSEINVEQANTINRTQVNLLNTASALKEYATLSQQGDTQGAQLSKTQARDYLARARERFAQFQAVPVAADSQRAPYVDRITQTYQTIVTDSLEPLLADLSPDAVRQRAVAMNDDFARFDEAVRDFVRYIESRGDELIGETSRMGGIVTLVAVGLLVVAVLLAVVLRQGMIRLVVGPLEQAVAHFERIAQGDLTARIEARGRNEIGQLFAALQRMQQRLMEVVSSLRESSESVFTGAREIAAGSQDLSSRTEEQASAIQETASSMEEMASTVRQNTDSALEADRLSSQASTSAESSGEEVERTVTLMREIAENSKKINDIIQVIDSIAFQTNILALNASVEAARAGEQGRGFAVVAGEVRSLASRSADSAREIRAMIEASTSRIEKGAQQAERSGETISQTVESIRRVAELMSEISHATREQNGGIEQINDALTQMDSATQQNAALVQQSSAAASSLEDQAQHLQAIVGTFQLDAAVASLPASRSAAPGSRAEADATTGRGAAGRHVRSVTAEADWSEF